MKKFPFFRSPRCHLILVGLLAGSFLTVVGCARALYPSHVCVSNLRVERDVLRCDVVDGPDSALILRAYNVRRRNGDIFVRFYTDMINPDNKNQFRLRDIAIELRDTDRAVIFTDGDECLEIWRRP